MKSAVAVADLVLVPTLPWSNYDKKFLSWAQFLGRPTEYRLVLRKPSGFILERNGSSQEHVAMCCLGEPSNSFDLPLSLAVSHGLLISSTTC
jgi:hypothetical protein